MVNYKREVAYKIPISELSEGTFVRTEGWQPSYLVTKNGYRVSRVNIIGVLTTKSPSSTGNYEDLTIDDGTGFTLVRNFESSGSSFSVGDILKVIGRPREYNGEKYLVPEIVKKIDKKWLELRQLENRSYGQFMQREEAPVAQEETVEEEVVSDDIYNLIKNLDSGDGVDIEVIIKKSSDPHAEDKIQNFLKQGEIFEIRPGRVKVLE